MKFPKFIEILGVKINIKPIKSWKGHKDVPEGLVGRYYPDTRTIYINTTFDEFTQKQFFYHEVNHAIMYLTGINQNISLDLEETIAQTFATFYASRKL